MGSYKQIFYQLVLGTKNRKHTIPEEHSQELYKYITGLVKNKGCVLYAINGISDHIHLFTDLHPSVCLADLVKDIKLASGKLMKASLNFPDWEGWADGYGAFTYNFREKQKIINYIDNQKEHHKNETFYDEYKRLLVENDIQFNEAYMLG